MKARGTISGAGAAAAKRGQRLGRSDCARYSAVAKRRGILATFGAAAVLAVGLTSLWQWTPKRGAREGVTSPRTLSELLAVSSNGLVRVDIAVMNLLCAEGLPGSDGVEHRTEY